MKPMLASLTMVLALCGACSPSNSPTEESSAQPASPETARQPVRNVSVEEADALLAGNKDLVVLDIRTPREYGEGHLAGARNIDFNSDSFRDEIAKLDRKKSYLVHCLSGGRSGKSLSLFEELGFESVLHLEKGFAAWKKSGKPVINQ